MNNILKDVKARGDAAVIEYTNRFDRLSAKSMAELELPSEDTPFAKPDWLGDEITSDGMYTNAYLSKHPYSSWPE